jgi:hypothetical protein
LIKLSCSSLSQLPWGQNVVRAWKSFDWDALDGLHDKGFIGDPKSKAKSVIVTDEGQNVAKELFIKFIYA